MKLAVLSVIWKQVLFQADLSRARFFEKEGEMLTREGISLVMLPASFAQENAVLALGTVRRSRPLATHAARRGRGGYLVEKKGHFGFLA